MITHKHTRTLARGHLIKGEQQSEEDNLRLCCLLYTAARTQSHRQPLGAAAGIQHGCFSLAEFFPFASTVYVNQRRVESLHAHYSLINTLITRKPSSIVSERLCGCMCLACERIATI